MASVGIDVCKGDRCPLQAMPSHLNQALVAVPPTLRVSAYVLIETSMSTPLPPPLAQSRRPVRLGWGCCSIG